MNFRFARIPLPTLPAHQSIGNHDKHVSRSSNFETQAAFIVHYLNSDNRGKNTTKGEIRVTKRRRIVSRHGSKKPTSIQANKHSDTD